MLDALRRLLIGSVILCATVQANDEFAEVNRLRAEAGLGPLSFAPSLQAAATRHAAYLDRHREPGRTVSGLSAHRQEDGKAGFSGTLPAERALRAGYPHREVLENVSMGYGDTASALDSLMSAIYHRLTFLDLQADQLGVAVGKRSRVFMLGRSDIAELCAAPPARALFSTPLDCLGNPMRREYYDALCDALPVEAVFRPPHPVSCPNGRLLDAGFMDRSCAAPPPAARFNGHGRYFEPCDNGQRIDADWFLGLCDGRQPEALYDASGQYYEICDGPKQVGAEWFERLCDDLPIKGRYTESMRFRRPCEEQLDVRAEYLDELDGVRLDNIPDVIVWPSDGSDDVPPAFFVEDPDPLPDREVAGYPISIQINRRRVANAELRSLQLYHEDGEALHAITATRLLDAASDPNKVLSSHEFALFPLQRLDWGASYRVVAELLLDGVPRRLEWGFRARTAGAPVLRLERGTQQFVIRPGVHYWMYLPPTQQTPHTVLSVRARYRRGNRVDVDVIDANTLQFQLQVGVCDRIGLAFDDGREATLIPEGCAE